VATFSGRNSGESLPDMDTPSAPMQAWITDLLAGLDENRAHRPKDVPCKQPEAFNGDTSKARNFSEDCKMQFVINPHRYPNNRAKIGYILSYCTEGVARDFQAQKFNQYNKEGWETWDEFAKDFDSQFLTTDEAAHALSELRNLRMTSTCDEYAGKFKLLAVRSGIQDEATLKYFFLAGLNPALRSCIANLGDIPETFKELVTKAQKMDNNWRFLKEIADSQKAPVIQKKPFQFKRTYVSQTNGGHHAMDVDAMQLAPEEVQRRRSLGLCFTCGVRGHIGRDCPNKQGQWNKPNTNPFRRTQTTTVASTSTRPPPQTMTIEERAANISAMLKGSEEENEQIKELLLKQGFH
jgi:hypothetical protein